MTRNNYKILRNGFVLAATIVSGHTRLLSMTDDEQWIEQYVQAALEVRGELMLSESNFENLNRSLGTVWPKCFHIIEATDIERVNQPRD